MIKDKHIFITGGAGFIANRLIRQLVNDNFITVFDNFYRDTLSSTDLNQHPNVNVIRGSVMEYEHLEASMEGADIVVHAAAIAGIDTVIKSPTNTMKINIIGTTNALEAAVKHKIKDRFVNFSTSEVFGRMSFKSTEDSTTHVGSAGEARWTYAVSKLAAEHLAHAFHKEMGLPIVTVRPFNVYGEGQTGEGAMQIFIKKAINDEDIYIYGDGSQIRSWCYVNDFIDGLIHCIHNPNAIGESFNIGNAKSVITTFGLAQTVCRVLNSSSKILFKPPLSADIELRIPSVDKADKLLGFRAETMLDEGILRTAEWMKKPIAV
ncbi:MAG: NAD-dependent epimerase/dehydratase family protein [Saprospiraceae bacterium]|nr:NAD-dependent epimerase/dehydratase family protein [Saprospiraceae bacterium]MBK9686567.1 NAD-dependent epimerase/dehydratase family protein [Saprospiraceae bacterium]